MRIDYILTVVDSIESYFLDELGISLTRQELGLLEGVNNVQDGVIINLKGNVEGKILVSISRSLSNYVIRQMTGDEEELSGAMEISVLKELVNQLAANIVNKLDEEGFDWDIGIPIIISNGKPHFDYIEMESLYVPFSNPNGSLEVTVAIKEIEKGESHE